MVIREIWKKGSWFARYGFERRTTSKIRGDLDYLRYK
jgi:hypothetical protein